MASTRWRRSSAAAVACLLALLVAGGHAAQDAVEPPVLDKDKAAGSFGLERPHLLDGLVAAASGLGQGLGTERRWAVGDKGFVGLLAGKDVEAKLCDPTVESQSGYFKIQGSKDTNYFYWFFESRHDPANDPFVVWLTGGPGCSSVLALLSENGPCTVNAEGTDTVPNPHSWTNRANVLWIDQPAGVGFSYAPKDDRLVDTEEEVGEDLYQFLQSFFAANPRFAAHDFYVFGESYGGHYVPAFGHRIFQGNEELLGQGKKEKEGKKGDKAEAAAVAGEPQPQGQAQEPPPQQQQTHINLKGLGIMNGLTDPEIQYQYYAAYGMNNSYGIQVFSEDVAHKIERAVPRCVSLIHSCQHAGAAACVLARVFCTARILEYFPAKEKNIYDITKPCAHPPLCYDFDNVATWLARPDVRAALHVRPEAGNWTVCSDKVMLSFLPDVMRNYHTLLPPMLEAGVKVLVAAGDADFICNAMGNEAWTEALEWAGQAGYRATAKRPWRTAAATGGGDKPAGLIRSHGGLTFLSVNDAGHMVPMDQPAVALEMLNAFTGTDAKAVELWDAAIRDGAPQDAAAPAVPAAVPDQAAQAQAAAPTGDRGGNTHNNKASGGGTGGSKGAGARALRGGAAKAAAGAGVEEIEIEANGGGRL